MYVMTKTLKPEYAVAVFVADGVVADVIAGDSLGLEAVTDNVMGHVGFHPYSAALFLTSKRTLMGGDLQ